MKKYFSVFLLYIRKDFWKFIILLAGLLAANFAVFLYGVTGLKARDFRDLTLDCVNFLALIFLVSFIALAFISSFQRKNTSSYGYTLGRLRVSEMGLFCMNAFANTCYFLILWLAAAAMASFFLHRLAMLHGQEGSYSWMAALLCGDGFLHGLIPIADNASLIRNVIYAVASGIACAAISASSRHQERIVSPVILLAILIWSFPTYIRLRFWIIAFGVFSLIALGFTVIIAVGKVCDGRRANEK